MTATNSNSNVIYVTQIEVRRILIAWTLHHILRGTTTATAKDNTCRSNFRCTKHRAGRTTRSSHVTTGNGNTNVTTTYECFTVIADIIPEITTYLLTITSRIVVITTAGIVTLTNRSQVTTTINVTNNTTAAHAYRGVTINLTGCHTMNRFGFCFPRTSTLVSQFTHKGAFTFATAIDAQANLTSGNSYLCILMDVAILTSAIDSSDDTFGCGAIITRWRRGIIDVHLRLTGVSTEGFRITLFVYIGDRCHIIFSLKAYQTLTTTIDITVTGTCSSTDATTSDIDSSLTAYRFTTWCIIFRCSLDILEFVWPAQTKAIYCVMLFDVIIHCSSLITVKVHKTYRSIVTATIDILSYFTARDINVCISRYAASPHHWREGIIHCRDTFISTSRDGLFVLFITTISTAKDATTNVSSSGNIHSSTVTYYT